MDSNEAEDESEEEGSLVKTYFSYAHKSDNNGNKRKWLDFADETASRLESLKTKQRVVLEIDQKREIIIFHDENPSWSQQKLSDYFSQKFQLKTKIARNTISNILSKRRLYLSEEQQQQLQLQQQQQQQQQTSATDQLENNYPFLEKCMLLWYTNMLNRPGCDDQSITDTMLQEQTKRFCQVIGITELKDVFSLSLLDTLLKKQMLVDNSSLDEGAGDEDYECVSNNEDSLYLDEIAELAKEEPDVIIAAPESSSIATCQAQPSQENHFKFFENLPSFEKKKRVVLDLDQKREIILWHDQNPTQSQQFIADFFSFKFQFKTKIARNTISTILSKRNLYFQSEPLLTTATDPVRLKNPQNTDNHTNLDNDTSSNLNIEEIIELAKESEDLDDNVDLIYSDSSPKIKDEPKFYSKSEALIGLDNVQGLLCQTDLLDDSDMEYISKLRSKLDLIN
jgi:hypothetical protein